MRLTPELLREYGFIYQPCGISGADEWQGMSFWRKGTFCLRGNISSTGRGELKLAGYFNSRIETEKDLITLYNLLNYKKLVKTNS